MKPKLTKDVSSPMMWNKTLQDRLEGSRLFKVQTEKFPPFMHKLEHVKRRRGYLSFFKINDCLIGLDTWDAPHPTVLLTDFLKEDPYYRNTKIIIKIQHKQSLEGNHKLIDDFTEQTGIPLTSWTIFPSHNFPLQNFQWENREHKYLAYISGKRRNRWRKAYADYPRVRLPFENKNREGSMEEYMEILKECRWGLCLRGKSVGGMDAKNRREIEFSSLGMPLILNYKPEYPFPFEANKDYLYIEPRDFEALKHIDEIDPLPFHKASKRIYEKYFSKRGSAKCLLQILKKFNILI